MENEVCGYCLLSVFEGLVCDQCLGNPSPKCLDCTRRSQKRGLVAYPPGQPRARGPHLLHTHLPCPSQCLKRCKPCFRLVNGFPRNVSKHGKPIERNYSSGRERLETHKKRTIHTRSLDLTKEAGSHIAPS